MSVPNTGESYIDGNLGAANHLQAAGVPMEKSWTTCGDDKDCEICKQNEAAGWIPLDRPFPSGHVAPLAHDECRCDLLTRMKKTESPNVSQADTPALSKQTPPWNRKAVNIILIAIGILLASCAVCGVIASLTSPVPKSAEPTSPAPLIQQPTPVIGKTLDEYLREFGGNRDVYIRILATTDCAALQEEFDTASDNNSRETPGTQEFRWTQGYMQAAHDQMTYYGCY